MLAEPARRRTRARSVKLFASMQSYGEAVSRLTTFFGNFHRSRNVDTDNKERRSTCKGRGTDVTKVYRKDQRRIDQLSPEQFQVTQNGATEPAFINKFWDHKEAGLYVDVVSGEPLFTSLEKFDSDCGWPSFTTPIHKSNIVELQDRGLGMVRTEVRSVHGESHLGHVFDDGPAEDGGLRYCINSAALRFIAYTDLEAEGYGEYRVLFDGTSNQEGASK
jgi:peptide-methionine (R)-S-oxide reductase